MSPSVPNQGRTPTHATAPPVGCGGTLGNGVLLSPRDWFGKACKREEGTGG